MEETIDYNTGSTVMVSLPDEVVVEQVNKIVFDRDNRRLILISTAKKATENEGNSLTFLLQNKW